MKKPRYSDRYVSTDPGHGKVRPLLVVFLLAPVIAANGCAGDRSPRPGEAAQTELAGVKADLESAAQERIAGMDTTLFQTTIENDPGYSIADCVKPEPSDSTVSISLPGVGAVICGNTEAGSQVGAWRRWYCEGIELSPELFENCVLGEWRNGKPTLGSPLQLGQKVAIAIEGSELVEGAISPFGIDGLQSKYEACRLGEVERVMEEFEDRTVVTFARPVYCK